jgi:hypothetical protein
MMLIAHRFSCAPAVCLAAGVIAGRRQQSSTVGVAQEAVHGADTVKLLQLLKLHPLDAKRCGARVCINTTASWNRYTAEEEAIGQSTGSLNDSERGACQEGTV